MNIKNVSTFQPVHFQTGIYSDNRRKQNAKSQKTKEQSESATETAEEVKERNQRYLDVLRDLKRLRDHYYNVYLGKLEAKVEKQRKELAAHEEKIKKKLLLEQERKAKLAHKLIHRLPKHNLRNDREFLQKVPKSRFYHLLAVEDLMKSRGLLKHKYEVEQFWQRVKSDQDLWKRPVPSFISPDAFTEQMLSRYSSLTSHSFHEQSRTGDNLPGILKKMDTIASTDERAETPPLVFPEQPKFPKLHSMNVNLTKSLPNFLERESLMKESDPPVNQRHRRKALQHHIKKDAYNIAVVNTAMTERFLKKNNLNKLNYHPLSEITELWCGGSETSSNVSFKSKTQRKNKGTQKLKKVAGFGTEHQSSTLKTIEEIETSRNNTYNDGNSGFFVLYNIH
uniref:uncharacterized protein LOC100186165 isoform X2 n=1 Tax=Ciona intestinalis TaxID=7719 RepID=UPI0002B8D77E|nr:uncharacterized protein LOC100186165 isoform X2 [Ciona intestinalis]|eukprot:XP_026696364.1 uncharacterized protein LOC100186165 isoform X2 [Ciona intestinalis]